MEKIKVGKKAIQQKTAVSNSKPILKAITFSKKETSETSIDLLTT